jgi:poly-beta-1,6 N-acetyl-D-glucosamine export porin PgaA
LLPAAFAICLLSIAYPALAAGADATLAPASREAAVMAARAGRFETAIATLRRLHAAAPADRGIQADLVTVLEWAGRPAETVAAATGLEAATLPDYALLAWARSLRATGDAAGTVALLAPELERRQRNPDIGVLHALALSDLGRDAEAATQLEALRRALPDDIEAAAATAYVQRRLGRPALALAAATDALRLDPHHREAGRQQVFALADLGAAGQAWRLAQERPGLLAPAEHHGLQLARAAQFVRWGTLAPEHSAKREIDVATALLLLDDVRSAPDVRPDQARRAELDRIAALRVAGRMDDVIAAYAGLSGEVPAYVHQAAADAFLARREPERAVALYEQALQAEPGLVEAQFGLVFALVESERHAEAIALLDRMAAAQPAWLDQQPGEGPNWQRLRVDLLGAMVRAYANQPAQAQQRLEALLVAAPASAQVRRELATVYRWRGWPERALEQVELAQAYEPEVLGGRIEHALTLAALERFATADAHFSALAAEFPGEAAVARELARWRDRQRWWLGVEAGYGESDGFADFGSRERHLRTRVAGPWLADWWRPYGFQDWTSGRYPEGERTWRRAGIGLDWRRERRHAYLEISRSLSGDAEVGLTGGFDWHLDDHWSFATRYESFSLDAPLRARAEGLSGRKLEAAARWQAHESLDARASLSRLALSDGNVRLALLLSSDHRLRADAKYVTSGRGELYLSRASQAGGLYFNPSRDAYLGYGLQHDWLTWRDYERAFTQRFAVTGGFYWQEDFGSDPTGALRYEHLWQLDRSWRLRYGVGFASRVYDGSRERQWDFVLALEGYL